jgi:PrtD family type I secretion system ABC transporter
LSLKVSSPLLNDLRSFTPVYATLFAFSFFCPILYLTSPIFVEQIFDRVMYSRSTETLAVLAVIATFLMAMYAVLEWVRKKAMGRIGSAIDQRLSRVIFEAANRSTKPNASTRAPAVLADFNMVRDFLSGHAVIALFDAIWAPLFIVVMTIVNWVFGVVGLVMIAITASLAVMNHWLSRADANRYQRLLIKTQEFSHGVARNSETVRALGMLPPLQERWYDLHLRTLGWQSALIGRMEIFASVTKFVRSYQMIAIFGVGALLYLHNEVTLSNTFVAMSLMMRGLGPIDQLISTWKSYSSFFAAVSRLDEVLREARDKGDKLSLPELRGKLSVARVFVFPSKGDKPLLNDVTFGLEEGRVLGVIGPSGAGKSCLARTLVGALSPKSGNITIGDHDLTHWQEDELGRHLGYMPQDVELLPGTVAENISRFDNDVTTDPSKVLAAAELAGIQDLIRSLPDGYNTVVGSEGYILSGGQRSRVALARAVYGDPKFIVLDEPNSSLDAIAEQHLVDMILKLRAKGATVVIVTHKLALLNVCDDVLVLSNGTVQGVGTREQIVNRIARSTARPALTVIPGALEATGS